MLENLADGTWATPIPVRACPRVRWLSSTRRSQRRSCKCRIQTWREGFSSTAVAAAALAAMAMQLGSLVGQAQAAFVSHTAQATFVSHTAPAAFASHTAPAAFVPHTAPAACATRRICGSCENLGACGCGLRPCVPRSQEAVASGIACWIVRQKSLLVSKVVCTRPAFADDGLQSTAALENIPIYLGQVGH